MWKCPNCQVKVESSENRCGTCGLEKGANQGYSGERRRNTGLIVGILVGVIVVATVSFLVVINFNAIVDLFSTDSATESQTPTNLVIYVCYNSPVHSTHAPNVTTVTTIEAHSLEVIRWIDRNTFNRQDYIDHYWGVGWYLFDDDIRSWFEGPNNVMSMAATYWELVEITDDYVITDFIWDYQNMRSIDIEAIWGQPTVPSRGPIIRSLEEQGATCVRQ